MARPSSPGALRGRAEGVVHGSGPVAAGPVARDAAGVVFVRAPHRRDRYRSVSARRRRVRRMSCADRLATLRIRVSTPTGDLAVDRAWVQRHIITAAVPILGDVTGA